VTKCGQDVDCGPCTCGTPGACTDPDPFDPYEVDVDLYTGCVVKPTPTPIPLVYMDSKAQLRLPTSTCTSNGPDPNAPYPYVAGQGWTLAFDESVEKVLNPSSNTNEYVLHTYRGDIKYNQPSMGGYIATPSNGTLLTVTGTTPPNVTYTIEGVDKKKRMYGNSQNNFIGQKALLYRGEKYGGLASATPTVTRALVITRNQCTQITLVELLRGPVENDPVTQESRIISQIKLEYRELGAELRNMSYYAWQASGPQLFNTWSMQDDGSKRIQTLTFPGANGGTYDWTFAYAGPALSSVTTPPVENPNVQPVGTNTSSVLTYPRDPNGKVKQIAWSVGADATPYFSENLAYLTNCPNLTTQLKLPFHLVQQYAFDQSQRRLVNFLDVDGQRTGYGWSNGALVSATDPNNQGFGFGFVYEPTNGMVREITRLPDNAELAYVTYFQPQSAANPSAAINGFLPTQWTDNMTGQGFIATYDSLNRFTYRFDGVNTETFSRTASTAGFPGGVVDLNSTFDNTAQNVVTLDAYDDWVAVWRPGFTVKTAVRDGDGAITSVSHPPTGLQITAANFDVLREPKTVKAFAGTALLKQLGFTYNGLGQLASMTDGPLTAANSFGGEGDFLSTKITNGGRTRQLDAQYNMWNQVGALFRNILYSLQTFDSPRQLADSTDNMCR